MKESPFRERRRREKEVEKVGEEEVNYAENGILQKTTTTKKKEKKG